MQNVFQKPLHYDNAGMIGRKRNVVLTADFPAITSLGVITAPKGMYCDGASIPQLAKSIIGDSFGEYLEECVIHDFLYSPLNTKFTRLQADNILRELMWNRGISKWKVAAFYLAVRIGGGVFYLGKP